MSTHKHKVLTTTTKNKKKFIIWGSILMLFLVVYERRFYREAYAALIKHRLTQIIIIHNLLQLALISYLRDHIPPWTWFVKSGDDNIVCSICLD